MRDKKAMIKIQIFEMAPRDPVQLWKKESSVLHDRTRDGFINSSRKILGKWVNHSFPLMV